MNDEGHNVVAFNNCSEAYTELEKGFKPDIMLVDLKMPGMSGKDFIVKMRLNPIWNDIRVAIITGSIPSDEMLPPKDAYQALIIKPFDLQELINTVEELILVQNGPLSSHRQNISGA